MRIGILLFVAQFYLYAFAQSGDVKCEKNGVEEDIKNRTYNLLRVFLDKAIDAINKTDLSPGDMLRLEDNTQNLSNVSDSIIETESQTVQDDVMMADSFDYDEHESDKSIIMTRYLPMYKSEEENSNEDKHKYLRYGAECLVEPERHTYLPGTCLSMPACMFLEGHHYAFNSGRDLKCPLGTGCCVSVKKCGETIKTKVGIFKSSNHPYSSTKTTECTHKIKFVNKNICQIRLDFIEFEMENGDHDDRHDRYRCHHDSFTADSSVRMPAMCGHASGQHIYLHVNYKKINSITFTVKLGARTSHSGLMQRPKWIIKVTQLECPPNNNFFQSLNLNYIPGLKNSFAGTDFDFLAPNDCLQYFTEHSGNIWSLGHERNNDKSFFHTDEHEYAICFKKHPGTCGITFTVLEFHMLYTKRDTKFDKNCEDSCLMIPDSKYSKDDDKHFRYCGGMKRGETIKCNNPGPNTIVVHRKKQEDDDDGRLQIGFNFEYRIHNCDDH